MDEAWIFEMEATDQGNPPLTTHIHFPVYVQTPLAGPDMEAIALEASDVVMRWRVEPGRAYQTSHTSDIQHPVWLPLTAPWVADGVTLQAKDRLRTEGPRFYRIEQLRE